MNVSTTPLPGVLVIEPRVFPDARGFFLETFQAERYAAHGITAAFVQDNWSRSVKDTVRGLHFQEPNAQGKLVWVVHGVVWDVIVDVRRGSPTFGRWFAVELSEQNRKQLWVPPGYAHGICVLSRVVDFMYKCTACYTPASERVVRWDDPDLEIPWPTRAPILSAKDAAAPRLRDAPVLPDFASNPSNLVRAVQK